MREKLDHDARKKLERTQKESENALKTREEKLNRLRVSAIFNFMIFIWLIQKLMADYEQSSNLQ